MAKLQKQYLTSFGITVFLLLGGILGINLAVDPLWYHGGNRLSPYNIGFDERTSKLNLLIDEMADYDCIIFGASASTVLNTSYLREHKCFNFAFSAGSIPEFAEFSKYLKSLGFAPKRVYTSIRLGFNTKAPNVTAKIPHFVRTNSQPTPMWENYLSIDVLIFSLKTLAISTQSIWQSLQSKIQLSPHVHLYDDDFECFIRSDEIPLYEPSNTKMLVPHPANPSRESVQYYQMLKDIFPEAEHIGYIAPISPWRIGRMFMSGQFDVIFDNLSDIQSIFDRIYDFSEPSATTLNRTYTWDGGHYINSVYQEVAKKLEDYPTAHFGTRIQDIHHFRTQYQETVESFITAQVDASPEFKARFEAHLSGQSKAPSPN